MTAVFYVGFGVACFVLGCVVTRLRDQWMIDCAEKAKRFWWSKYWEVLAALGEAQRNPVSLRSRDDKGRFIKGAAR